MNENEDAKLKKGKMVQVQADKKGSILICSTTS